MSSPAPPPPALMIGTPAYGGMVHMDYLRGLLGFAAAGIRFDLMTIGNESLITRARNTILSAFHARPTLSHLLFLDADVHLPAEGLARMLAAGVPVLGAPVALKGTDAQGNRLWNLGRSLGARGALLKVENVGTAVLLLARPAVEALVEDAIAAGRTYARPATTRGDFDAAVHYDVFRVGVQDGLYLSEDYFVCRRLIALGFEVCIDPTVLTTHHGMLAV